MVRVVRAASCVTLLRDCATWPECRQRCACVPFPRGTRSTSPVFLLCAHICAIFAAPLCTGLQGESRCGQTPSAYRAAGCQVGRSSVRSGRSSSAHRLRLVPLCMCTLTCDAWVAGGTREAAEKRRGSTMPVARTHRCKGVVGCRHVARAEYIRSRFVTRSNLISDSFTAE